MDAQPELIQIQTDEISSAIPNAIPQKNNLKTLVFYVTNRCNFRCSHCFYWDSLNVKEVLTIEEARKIADGVGKLDTLLVAGGEPFLRKDLQEICQYFIDHCGVRLLSIPTNGSMKPRVIEFVKAMHNKVRLRLYVSLDGLRETHNTIRKVDSFDNVIDLLSILVGMKKEYDFSPLAMITVSNKNYQEIEELAALLQSKGIHYSVTPVRGTPKESDIQPPTAEEWGHLIDRLVEKHHFLGDETSFHNNKIDPLKMIHRRLLTNSKKRMVQNALNGRRDYICKAGDEIGVVDYEGNVFFCELTKKVGNLKDFNWDFNKLWFSPEADAYRPEIQTCVCTHGCFIRSRYNYATEKLAHWLYPGA